MLVAELDALPSGFLGFTRIAYAGVVVGICVVARLDIVEKGAFAAFFVDLLFGFTHGVKTLLALLTIRLFRSGCVQRAAHPLDSPTPRGATAAQL